MTSSSPGRTGAFISYSHQDKKYMGELRRHLDYLEREGKINVWDDTKIKPGSNWREEINEAIKSAKVAILLISADFLSSNFIATDELPSLLAAARQEGATILPIIVKPCLFKHTTLEQFQAVNDPSKPLSSMTASKRDEVWTKVAELVYGALKAQKPDGIESDTLQTKTKAMSQALSELPPVSKSFSHAEYTEFLLGLDPVLGNLAVEFFTKQGAKSVDELIPTILGNPPITRQARHRLARLFGRFGEAAVEPLAKVIEDSDWHLKLLAAECFRDIPARVAGGRIAKLLYHRSFDVNRCAIEALGYMRADGWAFEIIELATKGEYAHQKLRFYSLIALTRMIAKESQYDFAYSDHFVYSDLHHLEDFITRCSEFKNDIYDDPELYSQVASVFREFKPVVIKGVVLRWAVHDRPLYRKFAADIFGWLKVQRTFKRLISWIFDDAEDYGVRCQAAFALGHFGSPEARSNVLQALRSLDLSITGNNRIGRSLHESLLFALSLLLYQLDNKDNLNDLNDVIDMLLHSAFNDTRAQTYYALGVLGYRSDDILANMDSDDYLERGAAALAHARINGSDALRRLQSLERDVANPSEHLLVLCSLIRVGQIEKSEELYRNLSNYHETGENIPYIWQREMLWSLARGTEDLDRAEAWADLMGVDLQRCLEEIDWIDTLKSL